MNSISICYVTARQNPRFEWFMDSLAPQITDEDDVEIIVVDLLKDQRGLGYSQIRHVEPKPTIWQGKHRITKQDWWAASNARNTGICLAKKDWIAFLDDRCVLLPTWLPAIRRAIKGGYCVAGSYEKRWNMTVENGLIVGGGTVTGTDCREASSRGMIFGCPGSWVFGCTLALPIAWALEVGGFPEDYCDGLSMEDIVFGGLIQANGHPIRYDSSMKMIEDRTPSELGEPMKRTDKGVSPRDKSHKVLEIFSSRTTAGNSCVLGEVRRMVQGGSNFPPPSAAAVDWYDQQPICEM